jgi:hypothetical protein
MKGYRTYVVAAVMLVVGLGGLATGKMDTAQAMEYVFQGLAAAGLRAGIASAQPEA